MPRRSSPPPPRRHSTRLSNRFHPAPSIANDPDPEVTAPSSVASSNGKHSGKAWKGRSNRKRSAAEVESPPVSQPPKRTRRGHSYPSVAVAVKDCQHSRAAAPKISLSSCYFEAPGTEGASIELSSLGRGCRPPRNVQTKHEAMARRTKAPVTADQIESDPEPLVNRSASSNKKIMPTSASQDCQALERPSDLTKTSQSKDKGKARRITSTSSEEDSESDVPLFTKRKDSSIKAGARSASETKRIDSESSEIENEMIRAALELSRRDSKSATQQSGSASHSKTTGTTNTSSSRKTKLQPQKNSDDDDEEDSDFDLSSCSESVTSASSLSSASSDSSEKQDNNENVARNVRARTRSRPRRPIKVKKRLTWWQKNQIKLEKHHPELIDVWGDLSRKVKVSEPSRAEQPSGLNLTMLPFQLEGLAWMKKQEAGPWSGGVLADEMGMGKTIQTISLILSDRVPGVLKQTLVIAPTVAIIQWRNEIEKFTEGLGVQVWHGGNRSNAPKEMEKFDVVLTSFAVLESTFRRQHSGFRRKGQLIKEPSLLHQIKWHRVILDEAHNIKDRTCNTAKGAFALVSKYKWCLSGTPLQNRVGELYSLIRFLGADPFSYYFCKLCDCKSLHWSFSDRRSCDQCNHSPMQHVCFWNNEILKPVQKYGASVVGSHGHTAFNKLQVLLDRMMLRRTKLERADDLGLPPRAVLVRRDYFTEEEEELYSSLYSDVTRKFSTYADAGTVLNNYGNIFQLITRMRQMSNHPDLVLKSRTARAAFRTSADPNALAVDPHEPSAINTCRICLDEAEDAIISRCRHIFCRECIRQYLETATEQEPECPVCHLPITIDLSQDALEDENLGPKARQGVLDRLDPGKWRTSTKIEALVEELSKLNQPDHTIKSIVFSQFTVFLDLIERRLQLAGFKLARLQGNMTPEARDRTIQYFMTNNDVQVFLVSLKAGGVALNLTEASRVFIMDPWWNPAVELQAMDRIHRLGQHRPVIVTRLIIENSIESRIVELQKKKEAMTGAALGDDDQALGRLTPQDLSFLFTL